MHAPETEYAFDKDLTTRLRGLRAPTKRGLAKWSPSQLLGLAVIAVIAVTLLWLLTNTKNRFFQPHSLHVTLVLGSLGIWRFSWWFTHAVRAEIYRRVRWPRMRAAADAAWQSGWRPRRLHILMTTYYEEPAIRKRVIGSILAQRRLAMQSHAMSGKVLTLTGRMSVFRAQHMLSERFIRTIEAGHLDHWLWGRFRFLSGDDKSTWCYMLTKGAKMTYVPDATVCTIEVIKENGLERMCRTSAAGRATCSATAPAPSRWARVR